MKFVQINLHHSKAATAVLCWQLVAGIDAAGSLDLFGPNKRFN
jgi:hypothetical protein